jgi:hypothetical protein
MRQPSAASPSVPVTKISSPGRAVSRRIAARPTSPSIAIVIDSSRARVILPPTISVEASRAASRSPA